MKAKVLFSLIAIVFLMVGCKANYPVAQQSGKEDMAYLVFVGPLKTYGNGSKPVQVDVDGTQFDAKVVKPKLQTEKECSMELLPVREILPLSSITKQFIRNNYSYQVKKLKL